MIAIPVMVKHHTKGTQTDIVTEAIDSPHSMPGNLGQQQ
jgi:hypothetical protein